MNKKIILILCIHFFILKIVAQQYTFSVISAATYNDNYLTYGGLNGAPIMQTTRQTKFYDARYGFKLGVEVNRAKIYKKIGLNIETGYSLGGFRFRLRAVTPEKLYDVHQFYTIVSPQIELFKNFNLGIGFFYNAPLFYKDYPGFLIITQKSNFGIALKLSYQLNKFNVGVRYFNYMTPYYKIDDLRQYWQTYDFVLSYRLFNF